MLAQLDIEKYGNEQAFENLIRVLKRGEGVKWQRPTKFDAKIRFSVQRKEN